MPLDAVQRFLAWLTSVEGGLAMVHQVDPPFIPAMLHPEIVDELAQMYGPDANYVFVNPFTPFVTPPGQKGTVLEGITAQYVVSGRIDIETAVQRMGEAVRGWAD